MTVQDTSHQGASHQGTPLLSLGALKKAHRNGTITTVVVCHVNPWGNLEGQHLCAGFFCEKMAGITPHGDFACKTGTKKFWRFERSAPLRVLPWMPSIAMALCHVVDEKGVVDSTTPRALLQQCLAKITQAPQVSLTLQFILFHETYASAHEKNYKNLATTTPPCPFGQESGEGSIFAANRDEPFLSAVRACLQQAGLPIQASQKNALSGQYSLQFGPQSPLQAADGYAIAKNAIKEIAWLQGRCVTFMAQWQNKGIAIPNTCTITMPWKNKDWQAALAGMLRYTGDFAPFLAATHHAYEKLASQKPEAAAFTWQETRRACEISCHLTGASLSPHLALTGLLSAAQQGLEKKMPFNAVAKDLPRFPTSLPMAIKNFTSSGLVKKAIAPATVAYYKNLWSRQKTASPQKYFEWA